MTPIISGKLGIFNMPIGINAQKIDDSPLTMYGIAVAGFLI